MNKFLFLALSVLLLILMMLDLLTGSSDISFSELLAYFSGEENLILQEFRIPKMMTALAVGAALSISGLQMQAIFRNPLAGPYVLGISSGASLGVAIVTMSAASLGIQAIGGFMTVSAAMLGALAVMSVIFLISARIKSILSILIIGMLLGQVIGAVISLLQYSTSESALKNFTIWTMGSLAAVTSSQIYILLMATILGIFLALLTVKSLNAIQLGENYARTIGINIKLTRALTFISTGILSGAVTAFCGPIGFIGIAIPHICRMIFRTANQFTLLIACLLVGPIAMLMSDIASNLLSSNGILPINTITAFIGIPVIFSIILRQKNAWN